MKKWTAAEIEKMIKSKRPIMPAGDYSAVRNYGAFLKFEGDSVFGAGTHFVYGCQFGNACVFRSKCTFENGCRFGQSCSFGPNCVLGQIYVGAYCTFGPKCSFGSYFTAGNYCSFKNGCTFGKNSSFGSDCSFGSNCEFSSSFFNEYCSFGDNCKIGEDSRLGDYCSLGRSTILGRSVWFGRTMIFRGIITVENNLQTMPGGHPILMFGGAGSSNRMVYAYNTVQGIYMRAGCFLGTVEEFKAKVLQDCDENPTALKAIQYIGFAKLVEDSFTRQNEIYKEPLVRKKRVLHKTNDF